MPVDVAAQPGGTSSVASGSAHSAGRDTRVPAAARRAGQRLLGALAANTRHARLALASRAGARPSGPRAQLGRGPPDGHAHVDELDAGGVVAVAVALLVRAAKASRSTPGSTDCDCSTASSKDWPR